MTAVVAAAVTAGGGGGFILLLPVADVVRGRFVPARGLEVAGVELLLLLDGMGLDWIRSGWIGSGRKRVVCCMYVCSGKADCKKTSDYSELLGCCCGYLLHCSRNFICVGGPMCREQCGRAGLGGGGTRMGTEQKPAILSLIQDEDGPSEKNTPKEKESAEYTIHMHALVDIGYFSRIFLMTKSYQEGSFEKQGNIDCGAKNSRRKNNEKREKVDTAVSLPGAVCPVPPAPAPKQRRDRGQGGGGSTPPRTPVGRNFLVFPAASAAAAAAAVEPVRLARIVLLLLSLPGLQRV